MADEAAAEGEDRRHLNPRTTTPPMGRDWFPDQLLLPTAWWAAIHPKMNDAPMLAPAAG